MSNPIRMKGFFYNGRKSIHVTTVRRTVSRNAEKFQQRFPGTKTSFLLQRKFESRLTSGFVSDCIAEQIYCIVLLQHAAQQNRPENIQRLIGYFFPKQNQESVTDTMTLQ